MSEPILLAKDDPSYKWAQESLARAQKENNTRWAAHLEKILSAHSSNCPCPDCREREEREEMEHQAKRKREKEAYQAKKAELTAKIKLNRGRVVVTDEDKKHVAAALNRIWQYIGDDVGQLYEGKLIPRADVIEMVLDAGRPTTIGLEQAPRYIKEITPTAEYLLRYPYETESRPTIQKIARETFNSRHY